VVDSAACPNSTNLTLAIEPASLLSGTLTSDCATVVVDTSNVYNYAMTISGDQRLVRQTDANYYLDPVAGATSAAPQALSTDTWGWALGGFSGFDANYAPESSVNLGNTTSRWAAMPATSTLLHQPAAAGTWSNQATYDIYFAAAADRSTPKGLYSGVVTFTVSSEGFDLLDDGIVVDQPDPAMIPVAYVGNTTTPQWVVADTANSHVPNTANANGGTYDWYDYNKKIWANSVTVTAGTRAAYQSAAPGTVVNPADVLGYFVYIPRYRYQTWTYTWNATNYPKAINIAFEDCASNGTACTTSGYTKADVNSLSTTSPGGWLTHPAFTFNGHELNGLWVGKFESTGSNAAPTILPDATPLTNITIGQMFTNAKAISGTDGATIAGGHGLTAANVNTRLPNGDDWGAIVYLAQSLYGVCTNTACTTNGVAATSMAPATAQKIWNNATSQCGSPYNPGRTGYGPNTLGSDACYGQTYNAANYYNSTIGMTASSTNNPTGIYDLAGGVWEYTLDVYNQTINTATSGISAFDAKYMNNYPNPPLTNSDANLYGGAYNFTATNKFAIGQALFEVGGTTSVTGSWYGDYAYSVYSTYPWAYRGGRSANGSNAGTFAFNRHTGGVYNAIGHRTLLSDP
jgi:hypothetical protein